MKSTKRRIESDGVQYVEIKNREHEVEYEADILGERQF